jgi:mono/diheme cytochrome c family protein
MDQDQPDRNNHSIIFYLTIFLALGFLALILGAAYVHFSVQARLEKVYSINVETVQIPVSSEKIRQGKHLVEALAGCQDCHGQDLGGRVIYEGLLEGRIVASNLTSGKGGVGNQYKDEDWVRAIRHGVGPDGKPLVYVSSKTLYNLSDDDVGAIIAYLKTIPPVDNVLPETTIGILSSFTILNDPSLLPAEVIDHIGPRPTSPQPGVTAEYGRYLTIACRECHGADLTGRPSVVGGGKDLTGTGDLSNWTEQDFITALRTGKTLEGLDLDPELMPWKRIGKLSDDELKAVWLYLQSLQH